MAARFLSNRFTRRSFLAGLGAATTLPILAACQPQIVEVEKVQVVEKEVPVERVITQIVREEVQKVVTVEVEKAVQVEKVVIVEVEKAIEVERVVTVEIEKIVERPVEVVKQEIVVVTATAVVEPTKEGVTKLTYWVEHTDKATNANVEAFILNPFRQKHPDIDVELVAVPDYFRKLETAIAARVTPDMFNIGGARDIGPLADAGAVADLAPYVKDLGWDKKLWSWMWEITPYKGITAFIPTEFEMMNLLYNKQMFADLGLDIPTNFDEILENGRILMENDIIVYGYGAAGLPVVQQFWWGHTFHAWAGGHNVWEALTGDRKWTDSVFVDAFEHMKILWDENFLADGKALGLAFGDGRGLWAAGRAAQLNEGTWTMRSIDQWAGSLPWDLVWSPMWRDDVRVQPAVGCGEGFAISSDLTYRDEAVSFADFVFFGERRDILKWADKPGLIATYLPPMDYEASDFPPGFNPVYKQSILESVAAQKNRDFGFLPWAAWPNRTNNYLSNNLAALWLGEMSAKEYMEGTQKVFEEDFEQGLVVVSPEPRK